MLLAFRKLEVSGIPGGLQARRDAAESVGDGSLQAYHLHDMAIFCSFHGACVQHIS